MSEQRQDAPGSGRCAPLYNWLLDSGDENMRTTLRDAAAQRGQRSARDDALFGRMLSPHRGQFKKPGTRRTVVAEPPEVTAPMAPD